MTKYEKARKTFISVRDELTKMNEMQASRHSWNKSMRFYHTNGKKRALEIIRKEVNA